MMYLKIGTPVERAHLKSLRAAAGENALHELERRNFAAGFSDRADNPPASGAHREDRNGARLTRAELHLVGGQCVIRGEISEEKQLRVLASFEPDIDGVPHRAVCTIAADNEGCTYRCGGARLIDRDEHAAFAGLG